MHARTTSLLVLTALASATAAFAQSDNASLFHDPQYKFAAQPPAGSKVVYEATAGSDVGFNAYVGRETYWIHAEPSPADQLDAFVTKQEKVILGLCSNTPNFDESDITLSGLPGKDIRAICASNDPDALGEKRIVRIQVVIRQMDEQGTVVYTLGMVTSNKHEARATPAYDALVASFRLLD